MSTANGLPSFANPPVVEVALAAQFGGVSLTAPQLGLYWTAIQDEFPNVEQQPPAPPMGEQFGAAGITPTIQVQMLPAPPTPRYLFVSADGSRLIQVQHDRFGHNWRKEPVNGIYPRYDVPGSIRDTFRRRFEEFQERMAAAGSGPLQVNWCEVTYLNHILGPPDVPVHSRMDRVLRLLSAPADDGWLPAPEDSTLNRRYVMRDESEAPVGRLIVTAAPAIQRIDQQPIIVLTLTARGLAAPDQGVDGVMAFLDIGREWVVRAFSEVTTEEMHLQWGRER